MKNRIWVLQSLFFVLMLMLPLQVFADEKDGKHSHENEQTEAEQETSHDQSEVDDHGHGEDDGHGHDKVDDHGHGEVDDHGHGESDDHGHGEVDGHGDDDHSHEYEEVGANIPLLSTFAAINGGFIVFGAVRKINKRRKSGEK